MIHIHAVTPFEYGLHIMDAPDIDRADSFIMDLRAAHPTWEFMAWGPTPASEIVGAHDRNLIRLQALLLTRGNKGHKHAIAK